MTTGVGPYVVPVPVNTSGSPTVLETTINASHGMVDLGGGLMAHTQTFNGAIPAPTFFLNVDDTVIVRFVNGQHHPTAIHWHGIELCNSADGTEVTQGGVAPMFASPPAAPAPAGGTYLYKFKVPRPGLYWYHPHDHMATNSVFGGMYGMIVVADPHEAALIAAGVIPGAVDTRQLVLSDITVCKTPGSNDSATYVDPTTLPATDRAEWVSGVTSQPPPTPVQLCEVPPAGSATDEDGAPAAASYAAMTVPSIIRTGRNNEGQTVLTNGMTAGGRLGTPLTPGALVPGAQTLNVLSGQGLRLQIANCSTSRYFRLMLTTSTGAQVPLVRIGGEGGLLDNAVVEGGMIGGFDTKYSSGEILLPAGSRADVVAAIPVGASGVLTLWTRDYQRYGASYALLPTVPVMHLNVTGSAAVPYSIGAGTALRASIPGATVETLGAPTAMLLDPGLFVPIKPGMSNQDIQITAPAGIDGIIGSFAGFTPYTSAPHLDSDRYAAPGGLLQLSVTNQSSNHHPFHLHGFSVQPVSLTRLGFPTFTWPYAEFRDNIDIPAGYTLTFKVRLDDRVLKDGVTLGGAFGRWLFHCHIFIHHHMGMISELVVTSPDGSEKPNVDVAGSWAYTPLNGIAERHGTFHHPDGDAVTLAASLGTLVVTGPGTWSWSLDSTGMPSQTQYVYITATDTDGRKDQAVFRLKIGAPDDGADTGDPHVRTVDGTSYDFQGVGEFTLLRDGEGFEIQVRQTPVATANPATDGYSGLTACVSINTAVAIGLGKHRISLQPGKEGKRLQFWVDGKVARLPFEGLELGADRITAIEVGGETGVRVDAANQTVVMVTPHFWTSYQVWYLNVEVAQTQADEGVMGIIPQGSWLPRLRGGETLGALPASLSERWGELYQKFAESWRIDDAGSLFVYEGGQTTADFVDREWPAETAPCQLDGRFAVAGAPELVGMKEAEAEQICAGVVEADLHRNCVFDVTTIGEEEWVKGYLVAQELRRRAIAVQIVGEKASRRRGEPLAITATALHLWQKERTPKGRLTLYIDGKAFGSPSEVDKVGRVTFSVGHLKRGVHRIRAVFDDDGRNEYGAVSSPTLLHSVGTPRKPTRQPRHHIGHG